jgi:hypothetical protein
MPKALFPYLKKGEGKLASNNHGVTAFSLKRKDKIIREQLEREKQPVKKPDE